MTDRDTTDAATLMRVTELRKYFPIRSGFFERTVGHVKAVDGVSLTIAAASTLAVVGETGSGKSTLGRCLVGLLEPTSGTIAFRGTDLSRIPRTERRGLHKEIQIVFQDPSSSLNPRLTAKDIVAEGLHLRDDCGRANRDKIVREALLTVGLSPNDWNRYPHMFSGGQQQRLAIARALVVRPSLIVLDEPTSALDVSIRAKILNLLARLQAEMHMTYLFITHDMRAVRVMSDRVAIMYRGQIVESGPTAAIFRDPVHPYTRALLAAVPSVREVRGADDRGNLVTEQLAAADATEDAAGCRYAARCAVAREVCRSAEPAMAEVESGHWVRCPPEVELRSSSRKQKAGAR